MIQKLRFYKTQGDWYIDLPEYFDSGGVDFQPMPADLQMVLGADTLLDSLSEDGEDVYLLLSTDIKEIRNWEGLPSFGRHNWEWLSRADYIQTFSGKYYSNGAMYIWLCPVTEFVFSNYPKDIYYKKVSHDTTIEKVQTQEDGPDF